jgi:hypothetical protein
VIEMNVSTRRDLMTFSSPFCELSGSVAEKNIGPVNEEGAVTEGDCTRKCELLEDAIELVRGRFGLTVGVVPADGKLRPDEPAPILGPELPPPE